MPTDTLKTEPGARLCEKCQQPLPADAHGNARYHESCYDAKAKAGSRQYYRQHAELLRARRRLKYKRQKQTPSDA